MAAKTSPLFELIHKLKSKNPVNGLTLEKAIEEAKALYADTSQYPTDSLEWELAYEKYAGKLAYIRGYIKALFDSNFLRSYNKMHSIEKEIRKIIETSKWEVKREKQQTDSKT